MGLTEKIKESPGTFTTSSSEESDHLTPFWYFRIFAVSHLNADIIRVLEVFKTTGVFVTVAPSSTFCSPFVPQLIWLWGGRKVQASQKSYNISFSTFERQSLQTFSPSKIHGPLELLSQWLCSTLDPCWRDGERGRKRNILQPSTPRTERQQKHFCHSSEAV